MRKIQYVAMVAICGMLAGVASAQDKQENVDQAAREAAKSAVTITPLQNDHQIYRWVKIDCDALMQCLEAAKSKSSNAELKSLVERMHADHKALEETAKTKYAAITEKPSDTNKTAALIKDDGQSRDERLVYKPCDFVAVKKAVCDRMKEVAEKEMGELSGPQFDKAIGKHLLMAHEAAIASIDSVHSSASKDLQACLTEAKEKMNEHLKLCRNLCKTMETQRTAQ